MSIKTRLEKLEQHQAMIDSAEDMPEGLSPSEKYMWLINQEPPKRPPITDPKILAMTPQEAYDALIGKGFMNFLKSRMDKLEAASLNKPNMISRVIHFIVEPGPDNVTGYCWNDKKILRLPDEPLESLKKRCNALLGPEDDFQVIFEPINSQSKKGSRYFCERLFWASQPKQSAKT